MSKPKYPVVWRKTEVWTHCNGVHTWEIIGQECREDPGYVYRVKRNDDYIDECISFGDFDEAAAFAAKDIAKCS